MYLANDLKDVRRKEKGEGMGRRGGGRRYERFQVSKAVWKGACLSLRVERGRTQGRRRRTKGRGGWGRVT